MTIIKFLKPLQVLALALTVFSCNNSGSSNTDATTTDSTAMADSTKPIADTTAMPVAFTPYDVLERTEKIKDYARWKPFFDSMINVRKANGLEDYVIGRNMADSNNIVLVEKVTDMEKAKASLSDPKIKDAIKKGGVIGTPVDNYWRVIRQTNHPEIKDWVEVTHKVKDFNAWLKVYDGEGPTQRQSEGMVDEVISRGIPDSNVVHIVFDVTDVAKAKAAIASDAKKKLMMSAGVEGKPTIEFYTESK